MIEKVSHAPRLELFARRRFEGWDSWGNEVSNDIVLANRLRAGDGGVPAGVPGDGAKVYRVAD